MKVLRSPPVSDALIVIVIVMLAYAARLSHVAGGASATTWSGTWTATRYESLAGLSVTRFSRLLRGTWRSPSGYAIVRCPRFDNCVCNKNNRC